MEAPRPTASEPLAALERRFFEEWMAAEPEEATTLGLEDPEGRLRDPSVDAADAEARRARAVLRELDARAHHAVARLHVYTSRISSGSGAFGKQNAAVAATNLFVLEAKRWLLPRKVGVALGPYFEGDLTERFDERYDAAYALGYPARRTRVRSMKFGVAVLPYFAITEHAALELGYLLELFGYDATPTQLWYLGARAAL